MLSSIINQIGDIKDGYTIEICISDNASPDDTLEVVNMYAELHMMTYRRNPTNIGASKNFIEATKMANGEYVWILGDDDILTDDAIDHIMKIIVDKRPDVIHVKALDGDCEPNLFKWMSDDIEIAKNEYSNFILRDNLNHLGFISSTIFKRDKLDFDYIGEIAGRIRWPHLYAVLEQRVRIDKVFLTKPLVIQACDAGWFWTPADWLIVRYEKVVMLESLSRIDSIQIPKAKLLLIRQLFGKSQIKELLYSKMAEGSINKYEYFIEKYIREAVKYKFLLKLHLFIVSIVNTKAVDIFLSTFLFNYKKKIRFTEAVGSENDADVREGSLGSNR